MRRIQRNYSQPFFSKRKRIGGRFLFFYGLLIGVFLLLFYAQFDNLQKYALEVVGMAPTATPFASTLATEALNRYARGDVEGASQLLAQAVSQQPDNVAYLYEYGKLLIDLERSDEAIPLADHALAVAPDDPRGYALKATALMWDDPATAIPIAVNGLEIDDQFAPLHAALAVAYTQIGRYQEALTRAQRAVELDPMDVNARRAYSWPLIYVGQYEQAIQQLEEAISINPYLTSIYFELASYYRIPAINQPAMAVAIYLHILELEPDNAKAYLRLCDTYSAVGEFDQAQGYCESALDIDPTYASAWRGLGQVQYPRRNYEGAIESFNKCVQYGSTEIECWYLRGLSHYILGECDQAWDVLNEALVRAEEQGEGEGILNSINTGLYNVTVNCPGYSAQALPTAVPPTEIPPTPIGGYGS
jgi:tetratricopeptide (TPR) repeat protein